MGQTQFNFHGSKVLLIGGTSGIGRAAVEAFVTAGADVVFAGLKQADTDALVQTLQQQAKGQVYFLEVDVRDEQQVANVVEVALKHLGRLDVCINNAGTEGTFGPLHTLTSAQFDHMISVNLRGVWLGMKYQIPHLQKGATIINTSSTAGVQALAMVGVYSATKHGIIGLTKAAALELGAQGIRVNAVAPGPVDTGLLSRMVTGRVPLEVIANSVPLKRIAQPDEIANAMLWLASDGASYVTGETLMVDGGVTQA